MLELTVGIIRTLSIAHEHKVHNYLFSAFHAMSETRCDAEDLRKLHYYNLIEPIRDDSWETYRITQQGRQFLYQFWNHICSLQNEEKPQVFVRMGCLKNRKDKTLEDYKHDFEGYPISFTKRTEDNAVKGNRVLVIQDKNLDLYYVDLDDVRIYKFKFDSCPIDDWMKLVQAII